VTVRSTDALAADVRKAGGGWLSNATGHEALAELARRAEAHDALREAARAARSQAAAPDYDEEAIREYLWRVVDLVLAATEPAAAAGERVITQYPPNYPDGAEPAAADEASA
jgi:hypothetical protein